VVSDLPPTGHQRCRVVDLADPECVEMMTAFIRQHPDLWNEDIGVSG